MAEPNFASLLSADEPTAAEQATAWAKALRQKQALAGTLSLAGGDLAPAGALQERSADQGQQQLMQAMAQRQSKAQELSKFQQEQLRHLQEFALRREDQLQNQQALRNQFAATMSLHRDQFGFQQDEAQRKEQERKDREMRDDLEKFGKLSAANGQIVSKLDRLWEYTEPGKDVPGLGSMERRVPDVLRPLVLSDKARDVQNDARDLVAALLQKQSGATVTEQERENKMRAYGLTPSSTPQDWKNGMVRLRADVLKQMQSEEAGFRPEVVSKLAQRGGVTSQALPGQAPPQAPAAPAVAAPAPVLAPEDAAAVGWAKANRKDPRAIVILKAHGLE